MFKNLYEAPQELATGGYVTRELHSVTIHSFPTRRSSDLL